MKKQENSRYNQRTMKTAIDRLSFAIDFAQIDLKAMRAGDKLNLRDDLFLFVHSVPYSLDKDLDLNAGAVFLSRAIAFREMSDEQIKKLQAEFLKILQGISMPEGRSRFASIGTLPNLNFLIGEVDNKRIGIFAASEDPRDVLIYRLIRLLESSENASRLQLCPACSRIFLKVKRQRYCSPRCANRTYMRKYRATNGEAVSDTNHKSYKKRTQKRLGQNVKVTRRRRK